MAGDDFVLTIGGDNADLVATIKDTMKNLGALGNNIERSMTRPQGALDEVSSHFKKLGTTAKTALAGLAGGLTIKSLTADFMEYNANLSNAVQVMGYNVTQVEALGGAMRRFGGDTAGAITSLDSLSSALQQARYGQGALVQTASMFGINYMKSNGQLMDAEELLDSLSRQLNTFDKSTKKAIASQLGLDDALLRVIDSGNYDSMIASQKKLNLVTQDDLKIATDLESAWLDFKDTLSSFSKEISRVVVPPLTRILKWMTGMMTTIKDFKYKGALAWGAVALSIVPVLAKVKALASLLKDTQLFSSGINIIKNGFDSIGKAIKTAFSPLGLVVLLLVGIAVVAEDLYAYFNGGDSIFGDLASQYPAVKTFLDGLGTVISTIKEAVVGFIDFLSNPSWEGFLGGVNWVVDKVKALFSGLGTMIMDVFKKPIEWVGNKIKTLLPSWVVKWLPGAGEADAGASSPAGDIAPIPAVGAQTINKATSNNSSDNRSLVVNNNITQNITGGDPGEVLDMTRQGTQATARTLNTLYTK